MEEKVVELYDEPRVAKVEVRIPEARSPPSDIDEAGDPIRSNCPTGFGCSAGSAAATSVGFGSNCSKAQAVMEKSYGITGAATSGAASEFAAAEAWMAAGTASVAAGFFGATEDFDGVSFPACVAIPNDISRKSANAGIKPFVRAIGPAIAVSLFASTETASSVAVVIAVVSKGIDLVNTGKTECILVAKIGGAPAPGAVARQVFENQDDERSSKGISKIAETATRE